MTVTSKVINDNEISLGGVPLKIEGGVHRSLMSVLPQKIVQGEYSLEDEQVASSYVINDLRGGPLIEELDESIHLDRYLFGDADTRWKGHIILPPLVSSITANGATAWTSPTGFVDPSTAWTDEAKAYDDNTTTHAYDLSIAAGAFSAYIELSFSSQTVDIVRHYVHTPGNATFDIEVDLYYGSAWHSVSTATGLSRNQWNYVASFTPVDAVTSVRIRVKNLAGTAQAVYLKEVDVGTASAGGTFTCGCNFHSEAYIAKGGRLLKLNAAGTAFEVVAAFGANITALTRGIHTVGTENKMYIYLGDTNNYWMMNESEAFEEQDDDGTDATLGKHWNALLYKLAEDGEILSSPDPDAVDCTWTTRGTLDLDDASVKNLVLYRDASGTQIIYAAATNGLWAHDYANAQWLQTEVELPLTDHTGKGCCTALEAILISVGLDVRKYVAGSTAQHSHIGLSQDDGIPTNYNGVIVDLTRVYNSSVFALVDSSLSSGTGYSSLWARGASAWQLLWRDTNADKVMNTGFVSSVSAHRYYFDVDDVLKYTALQVDITNPTKVTDYPFQAAADLYSGWYDGSWVGNKLGLTTEMFCKGMSSTEKITLYYRLDHDSTRVGTAADWTLLGEVTEDEETAFELSNTGKIFKSIQFWWHLERGATNTNTPDMQSFRFDFVKKPKTMWGWRVTALFTETYGGLKPGEIESYLNGLCGDDQPLVEFCYRDDEGSEKTYMAMIGNAYSKENTGFDVKGRYELFIVAPKG